MRTWHEIEINKYCDNALSKEQVWKHNYDWVPYNKGGDYRKWYGNNNNIIKFDQGSYFLLENRGNHLPSRNLYFKKGVTYSLIGNTEFCARAYNEGHVFDVGGSAFFPNENTFNFLLGLVNSKIGSLLLSKLNPTVNFQVGDIKNIPIVKFENIKNFVDDLVSENIAISSYEYKLYEENKDFVSDELLYSKINHSIEDTIESTLQFRIIKLRKLYNNESKLDLIFSQLYGVDKTSLNTQKKISLFGTNIYSDIPDLLRLKGPWNKEIISNFLNYSVGCMFGRYSLDKEGLILANQGETLQDYLLKVEKQESELSFVPDDDNIIPVLDDEWFEDDIVGRFYAFLKASFGEQNFEKNLSFVEYSLGKDIRKYFVKDFYKDHIKRYKKRPIYWMFSSPKGSFNVLVYMHRYTPDTLNQVLNGYLNEYREKLKTRNETLDHLMISGSPSEQNKASKEKDKIQLVLLELQEYERETLYLLATERISIDLDDGVLVNYNKFGDAIAAVAGLNDKKAKEKVKKFDWIDTTMIR